MKLDTGVTGIDIDDEVCSGRGSGVLENGDEVHRRTSRWGFSTPRRVRSTMPCLFSSPGGCSDDGDIVDGVEFTGMVGVGATACAWAKG